MEKSNQLLVIIAPNDVFGYGIGLSPLLILRCDSGKSQLDLRLGTGLAYFTEAYDPVSNRKQCNRFTP